MIKTNTIKKKTNTKKKTKKQKQNKIPTQILIKKTHSTQRQNQYS